MSYEHRLVEAANGREFYDKIGRDADAEIATLTERLRIVEAERDERKRNLELYHEVVGLIERDLGIEPMSTTKTIGGELSALRAELERKDAALKDFDWALGQLRHLYIQANLADGLKNGLLGPQIERLEKVRAALQPTEPPCQTA